MSKKVVGLALDFGWPLNKEGYKELGAEYVEIPSRTEREIIEATKDADAVFAPAEVFNRKIIEHMNKCRIISVAGTGYDHIDLDAATEHGICVSNVPDYCSEEVSDQAMALILACARKIVIAVNGVKAGEWDSLVDSKLHTRLTPMFRLRGQTLGIVGLGRIGRALIPKAKGFGLKVIGYDPYIESTIAKRLGVELVDFERLLKESDFVSLHMPIAKGQRPIIGLTQLKKMKPTAFLINAARGGLLDEKALHTAVTKGYIAGAGLDVTDPEPPLPNNPLLKLDSVLITPHSGYYSEQSLMNVLREAEEEVFRVLGGGWPQNLVNPGVKEKLREKVGPNRS